MIDTIIQTLSSSEEAKLKLYLQSRKGGHNNTNFFDSETGRIFPHPEEIASFDRDFTEGTNYYIAGKRPEANNSEGLKKLVKDENALKCNEHEYANLKKLHTQRICDFLNDFFSDYVVTPKIQVVNFTKSEDSKIFADVTYYGLQISTQSGNEKVDLNSLAHFKLEYRAEGVYVVPGSIGFSSDIAKQLYLGTLNTDNLAKKINEDQINQRKKFVKALKDYYKSVSNKSLEEINKYNAVFTYMASVLHEFRYKKTDNIYDNSDKKSAIVFPIFAQLTDAVKNNRINEAKGIVAELSLLLGSNKSENVFTSSLDTSSSEPNRPVDPSYLSQQIVLLNSMYHISQSVNNAKNLFLKKESFITYLQEKEVEIPENCKTNAGLLVGLDDFFNADGESEQARIGGTEARDGKIREALDKIPEESESFTGELRQQYYYYKFYLKLREIYGTLISLSNNTVEIVRNSNGGEPVLESGAEEVLAQQLKELLEIYPKINEFALSITEKVTYSYYPLLKLSSELSAFGRLNKELLRKISFIEKEFSKHLKPIQFEFSIYSLYKRENLLKSRQKAKECFQVEEINSVINSHSSRFNRKKFKRDINDKTLLKQFRQRIIDNSSIVRKIDPDMLVKLAEQDEYVAERILKDAEAGPFSRFIRWMRNRVSRADKLSGKVIASIIRHHPKFAARMLANKKLREKLKIKDIVKIALTIDESVKGKDLKAGRKLELVEYYARKSKNGIVKPKLEAALQIAKGKIGTGTSLDSDVDEEIVKDLIRFYAKYPLEVNGLMLQKCIQKITFTEVYGLVENDISVLMRWASVEAKAREEDKKAVTPICDEIKNDATLLSDILSKIETRSAKQFISRYFRLTKDNDANHAKRLLIHLFSQENLEITSSVNASENKGKFDEWLKKNPELLVSLLEKTQDDTNETYKNRVTKILSDPSYMKLIQENVNARKLLFTLNIYSRVEKIPGLSVLYEGLITACITKSETNTETDEKAFFARHQKAFGNSTLIEKVLKEGETTREENVVDEIKPDISTEKQEANSFQLRF